jgi:hypothetical protein
LSLAIATVLPVLWMSSIAIAGTAVDASKIALKRIIFIGRSSVYILVTSEA